MIDVTLTAARRPDLLKETLSSLAKNFLSRVQARQLFVNIDPIWGTESDADEVERLCRSHFVAVTVRRPERASFGAAVKWLWSQPSADWFLHIEDDWIMSRPINGARLAALMANTNIGQIRLFDLPRASLRKTLRRMLLRRRRPTFATSPSLVSRDFGRTASRFMDPDLDPEKQFSRGANTAGLQALEPFSPAFFDHRFASPLMIDIGREWREKRNIEKKISKDWRSSWTEEPAA
jgi:hypothetical protein